MTSSELDDVLRRLDALEKDKAKGLAEKKPDDGWKDVSNEPWSVKVGGRIHWDYFNWTNQNDASRSRYGDIQDYWEFRRIRLTIDGTGYGVYEYRWDMEFEPEGEVGIEDSGVIIRDLYVGVKELPVLNHLRFGYFKEPFSLDQLQSSNYFVFMDRAMTDQAFVGGRNLGIAAYNWTPDESVIWQAGLFFGKENLVETEHEKITDQQGFELVGRLGSTAYYCESGRYYVWAAAGVRYVHDSDGQIRFRARPETHEGTQYVDSGVLLDEDYYVANLEGVVTWGPLMLQSELFYTAVGDAIQGPGTGAGTRLGSLSFWGAYAQASYFLTGEHHPFRREQGVFERVKPFTNFWRLATSEGCCSGPGAWEIAARWSYLDLSGTANVAATGPRSGIEHNLTVGLNWYLNPYVKVHLNWIHTWNAFDGGFAKAESDILGAGVRWSF